tara:strand:+ start:178 stop:336 length:159 start_codon:yes stop_codon:yes gene_type:complete
MTDQLQLDDVSHELYGKSKLKLKYNVDNGFSPPIGLTGHLVAKPISCMVTEV